jgi:gas vesicle protein
LFLHSHPQLLQELRNLCKIWDEFHRQNSKMFDNQKEVLMSDRDEFGAFLVGFIVGGLSGAVVALLFAPQTGEETRALIKDKSIELRDKAQVSAEEAMARAEAAAADARARADEMAKQMRERGMQVVDDVRERGKSVVDDVRERGKSAMDAVRSKTNSQSDETGGTTAA